MFEAVFAVCVIIFAAVIYLANIFYPPPGSIFSKETTNDYHDGLVIGDAFSFVMFFPIAIIVLIYRKCR